MAHRTQEPAAGQDGMVAFYDAVADDPEMTAEQKIYWLRITAADYLEKLEAAERVIEAGRKREAAQTRYHALEYDYGTWHPAVMQARDARDLARKEYLDALAALTPARDEIA